MKKGDIVKINKSVCFTKSAGGMRKYPMASQANDENRVVYASRPTTEEEVRAWYESDESKGLNDAGESRLPPQSTRIPLYADRKYIVERARCQVRLGWGNPSPGMAKILCTLTGESAYIKRNLLEVVT